MDAAVRAMMKLFSGLTEQSNFDVGTISQLKNSSSNANEIASTSMLVRYAPLVPATCMDKKPSLRHLQRSESIEKHLHRHMMYPDQIQN